MSKCFENSSHSSGHHANVVPRYHYFEPFINLPSRSIKDYYRVISEPLSLRKLQKLVNGVQGRGATGVSEFKSWNALEEKASLLWRNAYYYNEEGSDIYELAKELEVCGDDTRVTQHHDCTDSRDRSPSRNSLLRPRRLFKSQPRPR
jgi:hypothetical protein